MWAHFISSQREIAGRSDGFQIFLERGLGGEKVRKIVVRHLTSSLSLSSQRGYAVVRRFNYSGDRRRAVMNREEACCCRAEPLMWASRSVPVRLGLKGQSTQMTFPVVSGRADGFNLIYQGLEISGSGPSESPMEVNVLSFIEQETFNGLNIDLSDPETTGILSCLYAKSFRFWFIPCT